MVSRNSYSTSGNSISTSSLTSEDYYGDNFIEEDGRISLAYENLRAIPPSIAEKFETHTKCLDLSYNNFQNLTFLSFFDKLDTLILDRNDCLAVNTLPHMPNLKILWINNCGISNIIVWIQRIQMQCPALKQLSIMGNPGLKNAFFYCTSNSYSSLDSSALNNLTADYTEYVLHMLPSLQYLDGRKRKNYARQVSSSNITNGQTSSATSLTGDGITGGSDQSITNNLKTSQSLMDLI